MADKKLIKRLDTVFSKYIRLRDSAKYNHEYFRCCSCGQLKPYALGDCGHFINRRWMALRFDERNCNMQCSYCMTPDTRVLMSDLRWKELGSVEKGDALFAFDENQEHKTSRRYKLATVTHIERKTAPVFEVRMKNGDILKTTADHMWLARRGTTSGYQWMMTKDLWVDSRNLNGKHITGAYKQHTFSTLAKPFEVVEQDESNEAGWLAGMIDADGHITQQVVRDKRYKEVRYGLRIGVSQISNEMSDRIVSLLRKYSGNNPTARGGSDGIIYKKDGTFYTPKTPCISHLVTGTNVEKLQFLQRVRPMKIVRVDMNRIGKMKCKYDTQVESITPIGMREIVAMSTSSRTFIAEGYAMHNCNRFDEGNNVGYMRFMQQKYGDDVIDLLLSMKTSYRWSDGELDILIKDYRKRVKEMKCS